MMDSDVRRMVVLIFSTPCGGGSLKLVICPVPAYYALILRSLTVLEGLALYADPNFKVLAASYPYFAKRLLTDPNPYLGVPGPSLRKVQLYYFANKCSRIWKLLQSSDNFDPNVLQPIVLVGKQEHHMWSARDSAGSRQKALNLVRIVSGLPNDKETIYGALDKWTAWEPEFPLIAAAKAQQILKKRNRWTRVIQV